MACLGCGCEFCECGDPSFGEEECPACGGFYTGMTCECQWVCIGAECINPAWPHQRDECYTVEWAEEQMEAEREWNEHP